MLPYARGLILDNTHNYGIMKTETVFGFAPNQNVEAASFNVSDPLEWIFTNGSFQKRSLSVSDGNLIPKEPSRESKARKDNSITKSSKEKRIKKANGKKAKSNKRQSKKVNKCIIKFLKKGQAQGNSGESYSSKKRKRNRGSKFQRMQKKYLMPVILGMLAAKSILIPIALKALAFMSAKGLMMAFFSTVMASVISLKGMFNHPQEYHNRKDDAKTQVEIIQVPTKSEDHVYYDEHYRRGDLVPVLAPAVDHVFVPNNQIMLPNSDAVLNKKGKWNKNKV